jgi:multisubunit Na+/H+ antiporter MnhC subunit
MRNIVYGTLVASALALMLADVSIGGIQVWKIILAGVGLALFVLGGRARTSPPPS